MPTLWQQCGTFYKTVHKAEKKVPLLALAHLSLASLNNGGLFTQMLRVCFIDRV